MPSPNYIPARNDPNPLGGILKGFMGAANESRAQDKETDALKQIYDQYQQDGQNIEKAIWETQTRPGISPTTRVNTAKQLTDFHKINQEKQKQAAEQLEKENKRLREQQQLRGLEKDRGLEPGSLDAYEGNVALAERTSRPKNESKKTQASQPIDPDQLRRIQHVESLPEFETASIDGKSKLLRDNGVSKENIDSVTKPKIEEEKLKPGGEYNKMREKAVADYVTNSLAKRESAEEMQFTLDSARKAVNGEIEGPGVNAIIKNDPYGQLFVGLTPDEAALQASNKKLLEGSKGIFGSKPTEREIFLLLNSMLPAIGKSKEANLASLYFIEKLNQLNIMHGDLVDEISSNGYVPDIESQVNQRMKPMIDEYRKELTEGVKALEQIPKSESTNQKIKVLAPDQKSIGYMSQEQIDAAKAQNVIFTPTK